uniref:GTP cyclohydrolase I feedback regulator n=1 Tax=Saimiri boliviensis boliviensis TaxID=39432 RepID=A0A2K6UCZ3_SAIBB
MPYLLISTQIRMLR